MALFSKLGFGKSKDKSKNESSSKHPASVSVDAENRQPVSSSTLRQNPSISPRAQSVALYASRTVIKVPPSRSRPMSQNASRPSSSRLRQKHLTTMISPTPSSRTPSPSRSLSTPSPEESSSSNTDFSADEADNEVKDALKLPADAYTTGPVHEGEPFGKEQTIGGLNAYITAPKGKCHRVILFICDVFGYKFRNSRIMADKIAANGFIVVMPDFFQGDHIDWNLPSARVLYPRWITRHPSHQVTRLVHQVLYAMYVRYRPDSIGSVGYGFGGKYAILVNSQGHVDVTVVGTPVGTTDEDISSIQRPILFLCADHDRQFNADSRIAATEHLASKPFQSSLVFYPGTEHGFCVRYHESRVDVAKAAKDALEKTIGFLITNMV